MAPIPLGPDLAGPLLGPLGDLHLSRIDWVIVGGETDPGARPMAPLPYEPPNRRAESATGTGSQ